MNKQPDPAAPDAPAPIPDAEKKASDVVNNTPTPDAEGDQDNDHGPEEGDEELIDDEGLDEEADEYDLLADDADPRLRDAIPTFSHRDAFRTALRASTLPAFVDDIPAFRDLFDRIRKAGPMAVETAWRTLNAAGALVPWDERHPAAEVNLAVFCAVSAALIPIADAQRADFETVVRNLHGEERLAKMRQARAGRRAKREARKARRPAAIRKLLANKDRNRKAAGAPPPPPKPQTPTKGKTKKGGK